MDGLTRMQGLLVCLCMAGCFGSAKSPAGMQGPSGSAGAPKANADLAKREVHVLQDADVAAPARVPPNACMRTEQGAQEFLNQFVWSAQIRRAYTHLASMPRGSDPDRFEIANVDNRWVYADPALDMTDYPRLELDLVLDADGFRVDYTRARFSSDDESVERYGSTGSYVFAFMHGCWRLVGSTPIR